MFEPDAGRRRVRARLRLTPPFRELLRGVVQQVQVAVNRDPELPDVTGGLEWPDPVLQTTLAEELREGGQSDAGRLAKLLARPEFGSGEIALEPDEAEAVMRGSVQVRLRLHDTLLYGWSIDELGGEREFFKMTPAEQQGYACYRILMHLEEDLLGQLDGEIPAEE